MSAIKKATEGAAALGNEDNGGMLLSAPNDSTTAAQRQNIIFGEGNLIPCPHCIEPLSC